MRVAQLSLVGFRSYAAPLLADFPAGPQVIVGDNATGKTNLLESLVVLGTGRSHRAGADGELVAWGAEFARLEATVIGSDETQTRLEVVIARTASGGGRKRVQVNGVARRPAALSAALPVVLFAPEDMLLISGGPALRRTALDTLVSQTVPAAGAGQTHPAHRCAHAAPSERVALVDVHRARTQPSGDLLTFRG